MTKQECQKWKLLIFFYAHEITITRVWSRIMLLLRFLFVKKCVWHLNSFHSIFIVLEIWTGLKTVGMCWLFGHSETNDIVKRRIHAHLIGARKVVQRRLYAIQFAWITVVIGGHFLKLREKRYRLDLKLFSPRQWFLFGIVLRTKLWQQHLWIVSRLIWQGFEIVRWWVSSWTDSKRPRQSMLTGLGLCVNIT